MGSADRCPRHLSWWKRPQPDRTGPHVSCAISPAWPLQVPNPFFATSPRKAHQPPRPTGPGEETASLCRLPSWGVSGVRRGLPWLGWALTGQAGRRPWKTIGNWHRSKLPVLLSLLTEIQGTVSLHPSVCASAGKQSQVGAEKPTGTKGVLDLGFCS